MFAEPGPSLLLTVYSLQNFRWKEAQPPFTGQQDGWQSLWRAIFFFCCCLVPAVYVVPFLHQIDDYSICESVKNSDQENAPQTALSWRVWSHLLYEIQDFHLIILAFNWKASSKSSKITVDIPVFRSRLGISWLKISLPHPFWIVSCSLLQSIRLVCDKPWRSSSKALHVSMLIMNLVQLYNKSHQVDVMWFVDS